MTGRLSSLDRSAAVRASLVSLVTVLLLVLGQTALSAAVTGGSQPMASVDAMPTDPTDQRWADAPSRTADLSAQQMAPPYGGGSVDEVEVSAVSNDTHVAFRLTWADPTNDTSLSSPENYSDAAAIMLKGGESPPVTMGAAGQPVNIWYWRSNWQFGDRSAEWSGDMYAYPHPDAETRPGSAADNPLSKPEYASYGQNYYAKGYGSLSHASAQPVQARGERTDEGWSVVFVRERSTTGQYDASFDEHETVYLAFGVWNGSEDEVNGQKSITLQFSTLDTDSGALGQADPGGASDADGSGSDGNSATDAGTGGGGPFDSFLFDYLLPLLAAIVVSWLVAYRRLKS
ncbi:ethylbenzene dehydrogenase-related protein [Halorubellus sp. PRR65]|uniref:ethylbenzene dehydrogenase-related protein n=1 Tax=Halorubellus sp. PRR65 TaxID=3098148 RepID=UPI002B257F8A|nr:ethylbenzene dehydrogenase-related protein [Halorubellus sp. PRR65]